MFKLCKFNGQYVTHREKSMFAQAIEANKEKLSAEIKGKEVCIIGGAGGLSVLLSSKQCFVLPPIVSSS